MKPHKILEGYLKNREILEILTKLNDDKQTHMEDTKWNPLQPDNYKYIF